MKLHIMSDLHLDTWKMDVPQGIDADVSLLVGDLDEGILSLPFVREVASMRPTIILPGNHEFYGSTIAKVCAQWEEIARINPNIIFMNDSVWIHKGVRFIGATLWTDFDRESPQLMLQAPGVLKDYLYIDNAAEDERILPYEILQHHKASREFIIRTLRTPFDGKTVVLTHHAPTLASTDEQYRGSAHNYLYGSDMDSLFDYEHFDLWVHGHMHNSVNYEHFDKRVINNPRGSSKFPNPEFDPQFVYDL